MGSRFFLLVIIFLPITSFSQSNFKSDSFKKFSHLLLLPSDQNTSTYKIAGGCFIRDEGHVYLVSVAHYFNGINVFQGEPYPEKDQSDTVFIRYFDEKSSAFSFLKINLSTYRKNASPFFWDEHPDILCMKLAEEPGTESGVIDITDYPYDPNKENPDEIFIWGHPKGLDSGRINVKDYEPVYYNTSVRGNITDSLFEHNKYNDIDFLMKPDCGAGSPGAPVFFRYNNNGNNKITFGGIIIGVDPNHHVACVVRPQQVKKAINSLKMNGSTFYYP
jgi:hypothetical protein